MNDGSPRRWPKSPRGPKWWGPPLCATALATAAAVPGCYERRDDLASETDRSRCTSCHGDPDRPGSAVRASAPPIDLLGQSRPAYAGVGAHAVHLNASETHAPVACEECHVVPDRTGDPGHADTGRPAELVFGSLAKTDGHSPSYSTRTRTCSDSYCHGDARAVWTRPRSSSNACGTCHQLPPPAPHPRSEECGICHSEVVDSDNHFLAPELHVDGIVQTTDADCVSCHGGGDDPAPPPDVDGNTAATALGVGAHQVHLSGGASGRPLACGECHQVPEEAPDHIDGPPAELSFGRVSRTGERDPAWNRSAATCSDTWCHGPVSSSDSPSWVSPEPLGCTSCHAAPPAAPHPQMTDCARCHGEVVAESNDRITDRMRHVDGVVDVAFDSSCNACHGADNPAPPPDVDGETSPSLASVGAHQTHVEGTLSSRAVPCEACHDVPDEVLTEGHVDTPRPAEVVFSGAALAYGATPEYANGRCSSTPCHGAVFPEGHDSGGTHTRPIWTRVDGSQTTCGSCHAVPPGRPHPLFDLNPVCGECHENIAPDNRTFTRPDLHVDGNVTFEVP